MTTDDAVTPLPLHRLACGIALAAYAASIAFQIYRATRGTGLAVDDFGVNAVVVYGAGVALALTLLGDRRWSWWVNGALSAVVVAQAPFAYYPSVAGARPLETWDWLEGIWFTALLVLVVACAVVRLSGVRLVRARPGALTPLR
ncbi:hypothetical protein AAH991_35800 [Microbispora sp. ZYX-F-249]|uniref:Integral membrane protein n=1 Tax=Microbispora maris TaxID=3144104 RepID=A0ABV0AZ61_9ACTN